MKLRTTASISIGLLSAVGSAQLQYGFTVGPDPLLDVYIFNVNTFEFATAVTDLGGDWTPGEQWNGTVTDFGPEADSFIIIMAVFVDPGTGFEGVTMSLPGTTNNPGLAQTLISGNVPWDQDPNNPTLPYFNNSTNFPFGRLPNESTAVTDILNGDVYGMAQSFAYMNGSTPVISGFGDNTLVNFDGAIFGGTSYFEPSPEPASVLGLAAGCGMLARRRLGRKSASQPTN